METIVRLKRARTLYVRGEVLVPSGTVVATLPGKAVPHVDPDENPDALVRASVQEGTLDVSGLRVETVVQRNTREREEALAAKERFDRAVGAEVESLFDNIPRWRSRLASRLLGIEP